MFHGRRENGGTWENLIRSGVDIDVPMPAKDHRSTLRFNLFLESQLGIWPRQFVELDAMPN